VLLLLDPQQSSLELLQLSTVNRRHSGTAASVSGLPLLRLSALHTMDTTIHEIDQT